MTSWRSRSIGYGVSAYLTNGVLIDCGFPAVARDLDRVLGELRPTGAIVTHAHEDHAGNVSVLARRAIPTAIGDDTLAELQAGHRIRAYRRYTWGQPRPFTGTLVPFDPAPLSIIRAPAHCPDHRIVWDAEHGTLFSADLWLGVHAKAMHVDEEDPRQLVCDLRAAAALKPAFMFDAHRGLVHDPVRALNAKADWLEETIGVIEKRIEDGWSDRVILRVVLGGEEMAGFISRGEYARANFIRSVRAGVAGNSQPPVHSR